MDHESKSTKVQDQLKEEIKKKIDSEPTTVTRFQLHDANNPKCANHCFSSMHGVDVIHCPFCKFEMRQKDERYDCVDCSKIFVPNGFWVTSAYFTIRRVIQSRDRHNQRCPDCFFAEKKKRFDANLERELKCREKREILQKKRQEYKLKKANETKQDVIDLMSLTTYQDTPIGQVWLELTKDRTNCYMVLLQRIKERGTPAWEQWRDYKHVSAV